MALPLARIAGRAVATTTPSLPSGTVEGSSWWRARPAPHRWRRACWRGCGTAATTSTSVCHSLSHEHAESTTVAAVCTCRERRETTVVARAQRSRVDAAERRGDAATQCGLFMENSSVMSWDHHARGRTGFERRACCGGGGSGGGSGGEERAVGGTSSAASLFPENTHPCSAMTHRVRAHRAALAPRSATTRAAPVPPTPLHAAAHHSALQHAAALRLPAPLGGHLPHQPRLAPRCALSSRCRATAPPLRATT